MVSPKQECVGTLLVPSSNLQELSSNFPHPVTFSSSVEGVGTIIVPCNDLQEFKDESKQTISLKKRVTVGSLLVPSTDLHHPPVLGEVIDISEARKPSLVRRFTNKMQGPAPSDAQADSWAD